MKTLIWYGATALIVGAAATISGQNESHTDSSSGSSYIQASKLVGRKVTSSRGGEVGIIKDVVIDRSNGCMAYTVVSIGGEGTGITSGGGKIVAVPWAVYSSTPDLRVLKVKVDRDKIYNAPAFEYERMDEYARPDYTDNIYRYYGVSSGPQTAVESSGGGTSGTDVTGTAGATASPGEVASPGPSNKGSPVDAHAASAASRNGGSSENSLPKAVRTATATSTRQSKTRGEIGSPITSEESASENTKPANEEKRSRRRSIETDSTARPRATSEAAEGED